MELTSSTRAVGPLHLVAPLRSSAHFSISLLRYVRVDHSYSYKERALTDMSRLHTRASRVSCTVTCQRLFRPSTDCNEIALSE